MKDLVNLLLKERDKIVHVREVGGGRDRRLRRDSLVMS